MSQTQATGRPLLAVHWQRPQETSDERFTPNTITLTVPGMGGDHCAGIVRKTLERLDGVGEIQTNIANHHVSVTIEAAGPTATP